MKRKTPVLICILLVICSVQISARPASAYRLPAYEMSQEERSVPAEETLEKYQDKLDEISVHIPLSVADSRRSDFKRKLSPKSRKALKGYKKARRAHTFWSYVVKLKEDLLALHGDSTSEAVRNEADAMAKGVIQKIYDLSQEYKIAVSALVHNYLINMGYKKKGFCYHYVNDLRNVLKQYGWQHFDLHWGEAWPKTYRENNSLVVTAEGADFKSGIAIDAWRAAGKPFWTSVEGDRFPWQEAFNIDRDYEVE